MTGILIRWLITTLAILAVPYLISGVRVESFGSAMLTAGILGILNALVRPILIILTLPLTVITLGFFILVVNALLFELAGALVPGMYVASFWSAFFASLIVSIVSWILNSVVAGGKGEKTIMVWRHDSAIDLQRRRGGRWE
jgi:putative membrane protein